MLYWYQYQETQKPLSGRSGYENDHAEVGVVDQTALDQRPRGCHGGWIHRTNRPPDVVVKPQTLEGDCSYVSSHHSIICSLGSRDGGSLHRLWSSLHRPAGDSVGVLCHHVRYPGVQWEEVILEHTLVLSRSNLDSAPSATWSRDGAFIFAKIW